MWRSETPNSPLRVEKGGESICEEKWVAIPSWIGCWYITVTNDNDWFLMISRHVDYTISTALLYQQEWGVDYHQSDSWHGKLNSNLHKWGNHRYTSLLCLGLVITFNWIPLATLFPLDPVIELVGVSHVPLASSGGNVLWHLNALLTLWHFNILISGGLSKVKALGNKTIGA
jgi:hypothetical protein